MKAALEICDGVASGAELHSTELVFNPGKVRAGDYEFRIGTAGSTTLLFQTLLPVLMLAVGVSKLGVHGGTHNPMAPSADFIERAFLPHIRDMGVAVNFECVRYGFAPAGGGCIRAEIHPVEHLSRLSVLERGALVSQKVECILANVRGQVADKELDKIKSSLGWEEKRFEVKRCDDVDGSGNALFIEEVYQNSVIHVTSLGAMSKSASRVAGEAVKGYQTFVNSKAAVDARLADQLLLPMALYGAGEIKTVALTNHIRTNIKLIEKFVDVRFNIDEQERGGMVFSVARI